MKVLSFNKARPFTIARVPKVRGSKGSMVVRKHNQLAHEWVQLLPPGYLKQLVEYAFKSDPDLAAEAVSKYRRGVRLSPEQTASLQSYVGITDSQLFRLNQALHFYRNEYMFCPKAKLMALKCIAMDEYKTLSHTMIPLQKKTSVSKGVDIHRDVATNVTRCRPMEIIMLQLSELLRSKQFRPSSEKCKTPFTVDDSYSDAAMIKFAIDAGGGSTKAVLNSVNVENPQGQEHVRVWGEFAGVKDSYENLLRAFFLTSLSSSPTLRPS